MHVCWLPLLTLIMLIPVIGTPGPFDAADPGHYWKEEGRKKTEKYGPIWGPAVPDLKKIEMPSESRVTKKMPVADSGITNITLLNESVIDFENVLAEIEKKPRFMR